MKGSHLPPGHPNKCTMAELKAARFCVLRVRDFREFMVAMGRCFKDWKMRDFLAAFPGYTAEDSNT